MLSDEFRVISDNGFKVELVRQLRDWPFALGELVVVKTKDSGRDIREIFDKMIPEHVKTAIYKEIKESLGTELEGGEEIVKEFDE